MAELLNLERDFEERVLKSNVPVIVDFWAPWCKPCYELNPVIDELERIYQGRVRFAKLNVEENNKIAAQLGVRALPTLFVFKDGMVVANLVGFITPEKIKNLVESWV